MRWVLILGFASMLGVPTAAADVAAGGPEQSDAVRALSSTLNAGWVWAGLAVLAGWSVSGRWRPLAAMASGCLALLTAVLAYYAYGVGWGDRAASGLGAVTGPVRLWGLAALVIGPLLGIAGSLARRTDHWRVVGALVVPVGAMTEIVLIRRLGAETFQVDPWMAATQTAVLGLAVISIAVSGWRGISRSHRAES